MVEVPTGQGMSCASHLGVLATEHQCRTVVRDAQEVFGEVQASVGEEAGAGEVAGPVMGQHGGSGITDHAELVPRGLPEIGRMVDRPPVEFVVAAVDPHGPSEPVDPGPRYPGVVGDPQGAAHDC